MTVVALREKKRGKRWSLVILVLLLSLPLRIVPIKNSRGKWNQSKYRIDNTSQKGTQKFA